MSMPELLAPAGNLEKLKFAVAYGADAVYLGGQRFGLRAGAGNFTLDELGEAVCYAQSRQVLVYVTVNIIPHNRDLEGFQGYVRALADLGVDGLIVTDPGIMTLVQDVIPDFPLHLSTQASNTNWAAARFWHRQGIERIILARELSLDEVAEIRRKTPPGLELEVFVHGSMCISYSGRCLLSNYLAGRDANLGDCAHPCRWKYYLVEEKRPGQYLPVGEDERGTFILNSRDLCMIEHLPALIEAGVDAFKIEGRMRSINYVATVVKTYRQALDAYAEDPEGWQPRPEWLHELRKTGNRGFTTGFFFGRPGPEGQDYEASKSQEAEFIGVVRRYQPEHRLAVVEQRNKFAVGDRIEIMGPRTSTFPLEVRKMYDADGQEILEAPHPQQTVLLPVDRPLEEYTILRRPRKG